MTRTGRWKEIPTLEQFLVKKVHVIAKRRHNDVIGIAACKDLEEEDNSSSIARPTPDPLSLHSASLTSCDMI